MARKTETREFGDNYFRAKQLKVRKANRVLERLLKIVGESLGALADNVGTGKTETSSALIGDLQRGALSDAAQKLVKNLGGDDLNWLVDELRVSISYQTPQLRESDENKFVPMTGDIWDEAFAGELMLQFKVIAWILQLNFGSFFAGVGGLAGAARQFVTPTKSRSTSQTTPKSGSGDSPPQSV
jgi:hypothetical protein